MVPSEQRLAEGQQFSQLGQQLQTQLDETETDAANTAYDEQRRQLLFGPEGFYNKKGKDALTAMQPTSQAIDKLRQQVRGGLATNEQKRLFDYMSRRSTQMDLRSMSMHALTEGNRYALDTSNAALTNEVNNSGTYWNDPQRFGESMGKIASLVESQQQMKGETDPESIKAAITNWQSEAWAARIHSLSAVDPHAARTMLENVPDGSLDAKHKAQIDYQLQFREQTFDRAKEVEALRQQRQAEKDQKKAIRGTQEDIIQRLGSGKLTAGDVLNSDLPAVGEGSKLTFLNLLHTRANEAAERPIKTVPSVMLDLFNRTHLPDGDPRKITDENQYNSAYLSKQLSFDDLQKLRGEYTQMRTPEGERLSDVKKQFLDGIRPRFDSSTMTNIDADGKERMYKFMSFVNDQEAQARKAGKNPYDLYNPNSPDYLGNKTGAFQATLDQQIRNLAGRLQAGAAARSAAGKITTVPRIGTDADYAALPSGTEFLDPNGVRRRKP